MATHAHTPTSSEACGLVDIGQDQIKERDDEDVEVQKRSKDGRLLFFGVESLILVGRLCEMGRSTGTTIAALQVCENTYERVSP